MEDQANPLKDVQNILGFLLAGFAGVLSFLGLRSGEVSAVLRNPATQVSASFIVLILFLAVLAAVSGVAFPGDRPTPVLWVGPIVLALLCTFSLMIYYTPLSEQQESQRFIWLIAALLIAALTAVASIRVYREIKKPRNQEIEIENPSSSARFSYFAWLEGRSAQGQLICILVSVTLLGISIYGAMRLEAFSQRISAVQISATMTKDSSSAVETLSTHVTGAKLENSNYVGVAVRGLPKGADVMHFCSIRKQLPYGRCVDDPCSYLPRTCQLIYGAVVPVNANGGINYTLSDGLVPGNYQDIAVQAAICVTNTGCLYGSRASWLDIQLSKLPAPVPSPAPSPSTSVSPSPKATHSP